MKAGDIKKFLGDMIESDRSDLPDPKMYNIHDNFLLGAVTAFKKGESSEYIKTLVNGFITTEELTVHRRVAVLKMVRDVLSGLSDDMTGDGDKERLHDLLTAYFV